MRQAITRAEIARIAVPWSEQRFDIRPYNFGANFGRLNSHINNQQILGWFSVTGWDLTKVTNDLDVISDIGNKVVRVFMQVECMMILSNHTWTWDTTARANLNTFMGLCADRGFSVVPVMTLGNHDGVYADLDGKFRWGELATSTGKTGYVDAQAAYIAELEPYGIVKMYELINEPYGDLTWLDPSITGGVTKDEMHAFIKQLYDSAKTHTSEPVGFSDIEEYQQAMYQTFSDDTNRQAYVDDCTDIYSIHIYRSSPDQVFDFRELKTKPKWCSELGSLNYLDPTASNHPIPGNNELYDEYKNFEAVVSISEKLFASDFKLIMPWSIGDNAGMITHNADGSHTIKKLLKFEKSRLTNFMTSGS